MVRSLLAVTSLVLAAAAWAGEYCSAIAGDTLLCRGERVLVEGVSAPSRNEPGALEARQRLARLIRSGDLVIQRTGQDKYGRTLGRVFVDGDRITQLDIDGQSGRRITRQATRPRRL